MRTRFPLIQKPSENHCKRALPDLHEAMKCTHPTIESFQDFQSTILENRDCMDISKCCRDQSPQHWEDFLHVVLSKQPSLRRYEACWPVEYAFDIIATNFPAEDTKTPALIPKPSCRFQSLDHLAEHVNGTHPTKVAFHNFKKLVRQHADKLLDRYKLSHEQEPRQWNAFVRKILASDPSLGRYEANWPVGSYFDFLTVRRGKKTVHDAPLSQHGFFRHLRIENGQPEGQVVFDPVVIVDCDSEPPAETVDDQSIIAPCCRCLNSTVANINNKVLREVTVNDHIFLRDLAKVGIVFDQHLWILLRMEEIDLEKLLFSMPTKDLSLSMKGRLLTVLAQQRQRNHSIVLDTIRVTQLPCESHPPADISGLTSDFRRVLQHVGVEELIPALSYAGILNSKDFDAFCQMSKNCRKIIMQNLGIKLSPLQDFLFKRFIQTQSEVVIL